MVRALELLFIAAVRCSFYLHSDQYARQLLIRVQAMPKKLRVYSRFQGITYSYFNGCCRYFADCIYE